MQEGTVNNNLIPVYYNHSDPWEKIKPWGKRHSGFAEKGDNLVQPRYPWYIL